MSTVEVDLTVDKLEPGDLVFCYRKDFGYSIPGRIAKEPWRHVGLVVDVGPELKIDFVQIHGNSFDLTELEEFFRENDKVGYARVDRPADCIARAVEWTREQVDKDAVYAFDDFVLAGVVAFAHTKVTPLTRRWVIAATTAAYKSCENRKTADGAETYICSAFVDRAFREADCKLDYDRWRQSPDPAPLPSARRPVEDYFRATPRSLLEVSRLPESTTMLDLYFASPPRMRSAHDAQIDRTQIATACKALVAAITGVKRPEADDYIRVKTDGRWVAPGDLWRSPSIAQRGSLVRPDGWDKET